METSLYSDISLQRSFSSRHRWFKMLALTVLKFSHYSQYTRWPMSVSTDKGQAIHHHIFDLKMLLGVV